MSEAHKFHRSRSGTAMDSVFEDGDLMALIVVNLAPACYVSVGRVCKQWRGLCLRDASLAIAAAKAAACLTKRVLMGLLALSSAEADSLPPCKYGTELPY